MTFQIFSIGAVVAACLPLREAGRLISATTSLYPSGSPALFAALDVGRDVVRVCCALTGLPEIDAGQDSQYVLSGRVGVDGPVLFSSKPFVFERGTSEETMVPIFLVARVAGFVYLEDTVVWELARVNEAAIFATVHTPMQLYFTPRVPPGANGGVPLEALRNLQTVFTVHGKTDILLKEGTFSRNDFDDPISDLQQIANWLFNRNPPNYDTVWGGPHYTDVNGGWNNVTLYYNAYIQANGIPGAICNCYDTAAMLQYLAVSGVGAFVYYAYMSPFGYLALTDLLGVGQCNNPFYNNSSFNPNPVCAQTISKRSAFSNHAFVSLPYQNVVADSCAGPHTGTENPSQYVANGTDGTTPTTPRVSRGTVSNIGYYTGVTSVSSVLSPPGVLDAYQMLNFARAVGYDHALAQREGVRPNASPRLLDCPLLNGSWQIAMDELHPGYPLARRRTVAKSASGHLRFDLAVASDWSRSAHEHYLALGSTHMAPDSVFAAGPVTLGDSSAKVAARGYSRYLWVSGNLVFDLEATSLPDETVEDIAAWLHDAVTSRTATLTAELLPKIDRVELSSQRVQIGEVITLNVTSREPIQVSVDGDHPGLFIAEETNRSFHFYARGTSSNHLKIYAVDASTLLSAKRDVFVLVE